VARKLCQQAGWVKRAQPNSCVARMRSKMPATWRRWRALAAKLDRMAPEDTVQQKVYLPLVRSIIERERGNATKTAGLLADAEPYENNGRSVSTSAGLSGCRRARQGCREVRGSYQPSRMGLVAGVLHLWRNSALRGPMSDWASGRKAAKPTTNSSRRGKTQTRKSRYSVKPKPSTRISRNHSYGCFRIGRKAMIALGVETTRQNYKICEETRRQCLRSFFSRLYG
jgi:hypothetical protein